MGRPQSDRGVPHVGLPRYLEESFPVCLEFLPNFDRELLRVAEKIGLVDHVFAKSPNVRLPKLLRDLKLWSFGARFRGKNDPCGGGWPRGQVPRELKILLLTPRADEMDRVRFEFWRNLRIENDQATHDAVVTSTIRLAMWKVSQHFHRDNNTLERLERQAARRREAKTKIYPQRDFPSILRILILERDRFACVCCGSDADDCRKRSTSLVIDHKIPVVAGGKTCYSNGQVLCGICNSDKEVARRSLGIAQLV